MRPEPTEADRSAWRSKKYSSGNRLARGVVRALEHALTLMEMFAQRHGEGAGCDCALCRADDAGHRAGPDLARDITGSLFTLRTLCELIDDETIGLDDDDLAGTGGGAGAPSPDEPAIVPGDD
jgi:hypothetical protein